MVTCPSAINTTFASLRTHKTVVPCIVPCLCALFWLIGIPPLYAGLSPRAKNVHMLFYFWAANTVAFLCAIPSIEIMGFTPDALGNDELSITYKFFTSHVSPSGLVAENLGESPMRAVPMMWNENSATCAFPQPAASISFTNVSSEPFFPGSYEHKFACGE